MPVKPIDGGVRPHASRSATFDPLPGTSFDEAAKTILAQANRTGAPVTMTFNGAPVEARPGMTQADLKQQFQAHFSSPAYLKEQAKFRAEPTAEQKASNAREKALVARENERPPRTGQKLIDGLKSEAKAAGFKAWDFYGVCNLRNRAEILEFAKIYKTEFPAVAEKNIRFAIGNRTASFTDEFWKEALHKLGGSGFDG